MRIRNTGLNFWKDPKPSWQNVPLGSGLIYFGTATLINPDVLQYIPVHILIILYIFVRYLSERDEGKSC